MTSMVSDTEDEIGIGFGPDTPNDVGGLPIVTCESRKSYEIVIKN